MYTVIEATYENSRAIRVGDRLFDYSRDHVQGSAVLRAARTLVAEGVDPKAMLHVAYKGSRTLVMAKLWCWADLGVDEGESPEHWFEILHQPSAE